MYAFKVDGQWLMLYPGSGTQLELAHPIVATSFEEPFSLPVEVPVEGNEAVLGHVHQLALAVRRLTIDEVELWRDGLFKHKGIFTVESSSEASITLTFSVDGFLTSLRDKRLRDVDYGPDINLVGDTDVPTTMAEVNNSYYPYFRFCFPMMRNKDAYGSNPDWWKEGDAYNSSTGYSTTGGEGGGPNIIRYTPDTIVRRERIYTCIGAAPAGENPDNTPWDWQLRGQGLINPWNPDTQAWRVNTTTNENAASPQFYLKDVLIRAMADQGYTALGDFIDDVRTDKVLLYNNQLLDQGERADYVLASTTIAVTHPGGTPAQNRYFSPDDDSTPPNEDAGGFYGGGYFVPGTTGPHTVRARLIITLSSAARVRVTVREVGSGTAVLDGISGSNSYDYRTNWDFTFTGTAQLTSGTQYYLIVGPTIVAEEGAPSPQGFASTIEVGSYLEWWRGSGTLLNTYATAIKPADHVPDITVSKLLSEVRQLFHLRITPDVVTKTITFNYQVDILLRSIGRDITEEVRGEISLDHTQRTFGVRLKNARGRVDDLPDLSGHAPASQFGGTLWWIAHERDLVAPLSDNEKIRCADTGQAYVSRLYGTNLLAWFPLGPHQPDAEIGEMDGALEIAPEFGAPTMDLMPAPDSSVCLMPVIDEAASSAMFSQGKNAPSLLMMYYHGMCANSNGDLYPFASPYPYTYIGDPVGSVAITFDPGAIFDLYTTFWSTWIERLVKAEVWQCDLDVSRLLTRNGVDIGRFLCKHQEVILHTIPLEYDDQDGLPLIAREARLLKLPRETGPLGRDGVSTDSRIG